MSGLLYRKGIDLEPYNAHLKALCDENNYEFINYFNCFLFASGELPATYFNQDELHLNTNGRQKLLSYVDKMCKVTRPISQGQTVPAQFSILWGWAWPQDRLEASLKRQILPHLLQRRSQYPRMLFQWTGD